MKFISLTTMILSVAVIVGADDTQIIGHPCAKANHAECGAITSHNDDLPFLFLCGPDYTITEYQDCTCYSCCELDGPYASCF
ncbi:hypothetical protein K503DRAFT_412729 [Rhizopogon vinicolor AM-OR11-026]|uniref:Uncharacterized protein n=1 Tax=Rhizopogon vinicolor AM-OR11-026 TaxID=1314800 RepID=A0A1B7MQK1_9AGAM|nr:hypothetical protein K503DRAFT_412729 [Rhizopogon vinicolor AM-OR11-026]